MSDLQVLHLTYTYEGGAGQIVPELVRAQKRIGIDARASVVSTNSLGKSLLLSPGTTFYALLDRGVISKNPRDLFSPLRGRLGVIPRNQLKNNLIVNLHWVVGMIGPRYLDSLRAAKSRLFWTLHDYRPFTGGCHFPMGCRGFENFCSSCPQARTPFQSLVERSLLSQVENISELEPTFICPSAGILQDLSKSKLLGHFRSEMIPYPLRTEFISTPVNSAHRNKLTFCFIASDVLEGRKGLNSAIEWWRTKSLGKTSKFLIIGENSKKFTNQKENVFGLGKMSGDRLTEVLKSCNVHLFASTGDTSPGVVSETLALGIPTLALDENMSSWLSQDGVPLLDMNSLEPSDVRAFTKSPHFLDLRHEYLSARRPEVVAKQYLDLYLRGC